MMFLGGPLYYCQGLKDRFVETLHLSKENAVFPSYARFAVAALYAGKASRPLALEELIGKLERSTQEKSVSQSLPPLFSSREEYMEFSNRHARASVPSIPPETYHGDAYLGIDCGSTTTKLVLMSEEGALLFSYYDSNRGNPIEIVKSQLPVWRSYPYSGKRRHRLWRGAYPPCLPCGRGAGGNHGPFFSGAVLQSFC